MKFMRYGPVIGLVLLAVTAPAQTYLGNGANLLNGSSLASTFEVSGTISLPSLGWTPLTGSNVQMWDASTNGVILDIGAGFSPYSVQFITDSVIAPNATYTLSLEMGYVSGPGAGAANYAFSIGTWSGSVFTALKTEVGGPVVNNQSFASGNPGVVQSATFTTGGSVSGDVIAIQWAQTNTSSGADFFAFDNVTLSVAAVPEPATYAGLLGALALAFAVRRRASLPV
jgi:hypothetical protein